MYKARQLHIGYESSQTVEKQGNRASIDRYLRQGFYVKVSRNGYWVLVKPAKVNVRVDCGENGIYSFNMKDEICNRYGYQRISENLVSKFYSDFSNGLIEVWADTTGYQIR